MPIVKRIASEEYADEKALYEALKAVENIPQSDWEQNDEAALDFIKNRTHYEKNETVEHTYSFNFDNDKDSYEYSNSAYVFYKLSNETQQINTTNITAYFDYKGVEYTVDVEMGKKGNYQRVGTLGVNSKIVYQFAIVYKEGGNPISGRQLSTGIWLIMTANAYKNADSSYARIVESYSVTTIKPLDEKFIPDTIARANDIVTTPVTAQVGQVIIVKSVDENGKPTEWECVDMPTGGAGSGLPPVTEADNGKVLTVVNGVWVAVDLPNAEEASF